MIGHQFPICVDFFFFFVNCVCFGNFVSNNNLKLCYNCSLLFCFSKTFLIKFEKKIDEIFNTNVMISLFMAWLRFH